MSKFVRSLSHTDNILFSFHLGSLALSPEENSLKSQRYVLSVVAVISACVVGRSNQNKQIQTRLPSSQLRDNGQFSVLSNVGVERPNERLLKHGAFLVHGEKRKL